MENRADDSSKDLTHVCNQEVRPINQNELVADVRMNYLLGGQGQRQSGGRESGNTQSGISVGSSNAAPLFQGYPSVNLSLALQILYQGSGSGNTSSPQILLSCWKLF
jgi:hypothetical protein